MKNKETMLSTTKKIIKKLEDEIRANHEPVPADEGSQNARSAAAQGHVIGDPVYANSAPHHVGPNYSYRSTFSPKREAQLQALLEHGVGVVNGVTLEYEEETGNTYLIQSKGDSTNRILLQANLEATGDQEEIEPGVWRMDDAVIKFDTETQLRITNPRRIRGIALDSYIRKAPAGHARKPRKYPRYPLGTWRIGYKTPYGRLLEQLREVRINGLEVPELAYGYKGDSPLKMLHPSKRGNAVQYAERLMAGGHLSPIEVVETDSGRLRVIDGHRRVVAHLLAGRRRIRAWVSPNVDHPFGGRDAYGKILRVPLTVEIMQGRLTKG